MAQLALLIVLLAFCLSIWSSRAELFRSPLVWLTLLIILWITLRGLDTELNEGIESSVLEGRYWAWIRNALFIPLGYFLSRDSKYIKTAVLLAATGLAIHTLIHTDWQHLNPLTTPFSRLGFGFTINTFALLGYCAALGLFFLRPTVGFGSTIQSFKTVSWSLAFLATTYCTLHTGSKSVLLMLIATLIAMWLIRDRDVPLRKHRREWIVLFLSAVILMAATASFWGERLSLVNEDYPTSLEDTLANATPHQSVGARIYLAHRGLEYWATAPLTGHGLAGPQKAIQSADNESMNTLAHLHSLYVELGVSWGLVGLGLFTALWVLMMRAALIQRKENDAHSPIANWLFLSFVAWLVWNLTEVRLLHTDGWMQWLVLSSLAFAFHLQQRRDYK